jgi:hypothetical protein
MDVTLDPLATRLLALMHEADTEAVTLDELAIAGVEDPARALHALELAGFTFERVTDRMASRREIECIRLALAAAGPSAAADRIEPPAASESATSAAPAEQPTAEWTAPLTVAAAPAAAPAPARAFAPTPALHPRPAPAAEAAPVGARPSSSSRSRADRVIEAGDRRPLLLALLALVIVALLGRAVVGRRD